MALADYVQKYGISFGGGGGGADSYPVTSTRPRFPSATVKKTPDPNYQDLIARGVPTYMAPGGTTPKQTTSTPRGGGGGGGGSGGGGQAKNKQAAANLAAISGYNAQSVKDQYARAISNYDQADEQNRASAKVQGQQTSKDAASDRFAQLRRLQASTSGIMNSAGNALEGSQSHMLAGMLRGREDLDTSEALGNLTGNQNAILNALNEALNTNVLARNEAGTNAENELRQLEAEMAAQLNNIDPSLFVAPGTGNTNMGSAGFASSRMTPANLAKLTGYYTTNPAARTTTTQSGGGTYFDKLMNSYYGRQ